MVGVSATPLGPLSTSPPLITIYSCKQSSEILICSPHKKPHLLNMFLPNSNDITTTFSSKLESLVGDKTEKQSSKLTCPKWALQLMLQCYKTFPFQRQRVLKFQSKLCSFPTQFNSTDFWIVYACEQCNCESYCACHCCSFIANTKDKSRTRQRVNQNSEKYILKYVKRML